MEKIYTSKKKTLILGVMCFLCSIVFQQNLMAQNNRYVIKGKVVDMRTGQSLPGVSVKLGNSVLGASTDVNGNYQLGADLSPGVYAITFNFISYKPETRSVTLGTDNNVTLNISLSEDFVSLNEVVVTGTSVATSKRQLGNAISTVSSRDIESSAAISVDQALSGKISGAQITQNSGNPAGGISVRLRGVSTVVGSADPLYIVDGVIVNNSSPQLIDLGGYAQNRLVDINPNDIDRIEVIKGAAAAAIYGSRASNGVVQIFTKRGKEGKPSINFSTQARVSDLRKKLEFNTYPFRFNNTIVTDLSQTPVQRFDYQDQIFKTAIGTENNISVSGGSSGTQYYLSGSFLDNKGIVENSKFNRSGARLRLEQTLANWAKVSFGANYVLSTSREIPNGGINEAYGALTGFIFSNNFINPQPDPVTGIYPSTAPTSILRRTNPLEAINRFDFRQRTNRFIGDFQLTLTPLDGLVVNYVLGYDNSTQLATGYIPVRNTTPSYDSGFSRRADQTTYQLNNDLNISYKRKFTSWLESTTGFGATAQTEKNYTTAITATQLGLIGQTINNGATIVSGEARSDLNIMGAFVQQTFGILDRIFLTGAARYDVSSAFGENNRGQFYPKVSGSYVVSSENFWQNSGINDIISGFKLRASYGQAGNLTAIGAYDRFTTYAPVSLPGLPGVISPSLLGNSGIKPERQTEVEFGTDLSFLRERIGLEFTFYNKDVKDLLLNRTLAPSTGYSTRFENVGTMTNKGFELLFRAVPIQNANLKWNTTLTYSRNKNEVGGIEGGVLPFAGGFGQVAAVNGFPLGAFYSTYFARNPDGSLLLTAGGLPQAERAGRNAAGQPLGATRSKVIGDPNPDWTGSLINEFNIGKKLSFRTQFDASYGFDVFNFTQRVGNRDFYGGLKGYERELRGEVPKGTSAALFGVFENWIEDDSFVKLREVSLGYDLQPKFLHNGRMRLSVSGRNLFSIDDYSGYDPEVNSAGQSTAVRGFDFVEVPIPRTILVGVNMTF